MGGTKRLGMEVPCTRCLIEGPAHSRLSASFHGAAVHWGRTWGDASELETEPSCTYGFVWIDG